MYSAASLRTCRVSGVVEEPLSRRVLQANDTSHLPRLFQTLRDIEIVEHFEIPTENQSSLMTLERIPNNEDAR